MSYNYHISPAVIIAGDDMKNVKHKLGLTYNHEVMEALNDEGFTTIVNFEPVEGGLSFVSLGVSRFGEVSEDEGIAGAVKAFGRFLHFTGSNIPSACYRLSGDRFRLTGDIAHYEDISVR